MSRSKRKSKRKGCIGCCYDDGFCKVNRHGLCPSCMEKRIKEKTANGEVNE